jgi:hypothetical protein
VRQVALVAVRQIRLPPGEQEQQVKDLMVVLVLVVEMGGLEEAVLALWV